MIRPLSRAILIVAGLAGSASMAAAQSIDFANQPGVPVEVYADKGLELSQDAKTLIARGNARAVRGRVTVTADTLIAHYREKKSADAGKAEPATPAVAKSGEDPDDRPEQQRGLAPGSRWACTDLYRLAARLCRSCRLQHR